MAPALNFDPIPKVVERFALLARFSDEECQPYLPLCQDSWNAILQKCRPADSLPDGDALLLCNAAASLAFYQFALSCAALPTPDFSAGDVRVASPKPDLAAAQSLYHDACACAASLLVDQNFLFRTFRGDRFVPQ